MKKVYLDKYIAYIKNTGGAPTIDQFDEDWFPIGHKIRSRLVNQGYAVEVDGVIRMRNDIDPKPKAQNVVPVGINSKEDFGKF